MVFVLLFSLAPICPTRHRRYFPKLQLNGVFGFLIYTQKNTFITNINLLQFVRAIFTMLQLVHMFLYNTFLSFSTEKVVLFNALFIPFQFWEIIESVEEKINIFTNQMVALRDKGMMNRQSPIFVIAH